MARSTHITTDAIAERLESLEGEVAMLSRELEHAQRLSMLGTVSAGVAHEINNIITPALGYAELADRHPEDRALMTKALGRSVTAMKTAAHIVRAILGAAADTDEPSGAVVDAVVEDTLACIGSAPAKAGVTITTGCDAVGRVAIRPVALQQVLMNLVINAVQAMQDRGGEVSITAAEDRDAVTIVVQDTGPGIPDHVRDHLFEPFVSGSPTHASDERIQGTGLGLAICQNLVQAANGTIEVDSAVGRGTRFAIVLPIAPNETRTF